MESEPVARFDGVAGTPDRVWAIVYGHQHLFAGCVGAFLDEERAAAEVASLEREDVDEDWCYAALELGLLSDGVSGAEYRRKLVVEVEDEPATPKKAAGAANVPVVIDVEDEPATPI